MPKRPKQNSDHAQRHHTPTIDNEAMSSAGYAYANRYFDKLEDLGEVLFQRCKVLLKQQYLIRAITYYHWWPQTAY